MLKKFFAILAAGFFIFSAAPTTFAAKDDNFLTATGYGFGPKGANPKGSFYKSFARQVAKLDAVRRIVELTSIMAEDTNLQEEVTVSESVTIKLEVTKFKAETMEVINEKFDDGIFEVTVRMPIFE